MNYLKNTDAVALERSEVGFFWHLSLSTLSFRLILSQIITERSMAKNFGVHN